MTIQNYITTTNYTVQFYCKTPVFENHPKKAAEALKDKLLSLAPPQPIDPSIHGDMIRFKHEKHVYEITKAALEAEKKLCDDLALAVEWDLHPEKKRKSIRLYQQMKKKTPEAKALKILANTWRENNKALCTLKLLQKEL